MKEISSIFALLCATSALAAGGYPAVSSPWAELRKAPVFSADTLPLAKTWGLALPNGSEFVVEKVYGRWVFGRPAPIAHMKATDHAPSGWVFSRQLLIPGDADTLSPAQWKGLRAAIYHSRAARPRLFLDAKGPGPLEFLETLTLSRNTLAAFSLPEPGLEPLKQPRPAPENQSGLFSLIPIASAAEAEPSLGLTGTDLSFLDQEIKVVEARKRGEAKQRESRKVKAPPPPALDSAAKHSVLGRFILERYLDLPALTMEEVDGHIYMRATAMRALGGCPREVQERWKNRPWGLFRVYRLRSRPELRHPWFEIALPGGYFAVSGRAIEAAADEAELAFLLVRQLVRELRVKRPALLLPAKDWPTGLSGVSEEIWDQVLKAQSTKESPNLDVADEIAVDMRAVECISRAGYRPSAGLSYLKKLAAAKDQPWAEWFARHTIGLEYRIERVTALTQEALAQQRFPAGKSSQAKRFAQASQQWNLLP